MPQNIKHAILPAMIFALVALFGPSPVFANLSFLQWLDHLKTDAAAMGISAATFDASFKGVTPNLKLPDLVKPGETPLPGKGQAEFSKTPQSYMARSYMTRLAAHGKGLRVKHGSTLSLIEDGFEVPRDIVLAIWGRETSFGRYRLRHNAIRALATQAYLGRRKAMFRRELLFALKMLEDKLAVLADMRSSWAGALGLTQTMPSEFYNSTVDLDGDGRRDIWRSVPDALGSAARLLKNKGWVPGQSWGYEVKLERGRAGLDCALEGPAQARSIGQWQALGLKRTHGRNFAPELHKISAYMMSPAGSLGPTFLVTENFSVLKRYNPSDLYALFVGHLADRIGGSGTFATRWSKIRQLPRKEIAAIQAALTAKGYTAVGKVDGLIGSNTRGQIGLYQRRNKLRVTCWPTTKVLQHLRRNVAAK